MCVERGPQRCGPCSVRRSLGAELIEQLREESAVRSSLASLLYGLRE